MFLWDPVLVNNSFPEHLVGMSLHFLPQKWVQGGIMAEAFGPKDKRDD